MRPFGRANDLWSWDGSGWTLLTPSPLPRSWPSTRNGHGLAYDATSRGVLLVGGQTNSTQSDETWLYAEGLSERPGLVYRLAFAFAQAGVGAVVRSVDAQVEAAGGGAQVDGGAVSGAVLWRYSPREQAFFPELGNDAGVGGSPSPLFWASADAGVLDDLFVGPRQELTFAVSPVGANDGQTTAALRASGITVVVRYRRP